MAIKLDNGVTVREDIRVTTAVTKNANVAATFGSARGKDVTIHHWGVDGQNERGVVTFLATNGNTSAHIVVGEEVWFLADFNDATWHAGNATGNAKTIGIECRPEMTQKNLDNLAAVLRYIEKNVKKAPITIYKHSDWTATACPGRYGSKIDWLVQQVNFTPKPPAPKPPAPSPSPSKPNPKGTTNTYAIVSKGDTLSKISTQFYGDATFAAKIAEYNRIALTTPLQVGWKLMIPGPLLWIVDPGDTLGKIAAKYGVTAQWLATYNGIGVNSILKVGQRIYIQK